MSDGEAPLAVLPLLERTDPWRVWYKDPKHELEWKVGAGKFVVIDGDIDPRVKWVKKFSGWPNKDMYSYIHVYEEQIRNGSMTEWNPHEKEGYVSPRREAIRTAAAVHQKVLGNKRIQKKAETVKGALEVGDVVHYPVKSKFKGAMSHTVIVGTVMSCLGGQQ